MGDEDQQRPAQPSQSPSEPKKPGSVEAGLHEPAGSIAAAPAWADSLSKGVPTSRSRLDVDLAKRLREEEAARIARKQAEEEAKRRAAAEAARRAKEEAARQQAPARPASPGPRKVSKIPSILAAAAVIALGAFVGQRILASDEGSVPSETTAPTAFPVTSSAPTSAAKPTTAPQSPAGSQASRLDTYTVRPGDTLESIAQRFGRTPTEISQANGAYGGLIRVQAGQVINIP